jgi:hypothetical protein
MRALRIAILLLLPLAPMLSSASPDNEPHSLAQYVTVLEQLRQTTTGADPRPALPQLPSEWRISADGREFTVSTDSLRQCFSDYQKQRTPANRDAISAQLDLLLRDAHEMRGSKTDFSPERNRLSEILSRREFRNIAGETWWDRIKHAIQRWLWHLLERLLTSSAYPVVSRVVIWGLLALAVAVVALWLVRNYREKNIYPRFSGSPDTVSAKPWRDWQSEAQLAAQEGRWRDAVHLTYWAGISFLESQGLWRPDLARTPREYLRLLPAGDEHRDPLQQLTRSFEKVWYGNDVATSQTFAGASALLERLGCR